MTALFAALFLLAVGYGLVERRWRRSLEAASIRSLRIAERERANTFNMRLRAERAEMRADDAEMRLAELSRSVVPTDEEINQWLESAGR